MPLKRPSQLPTLPPYQRQLLLEPETLLQTLNYIVSSLIGKTITDIDLAGGLALQENPTAYTISGGVIDLEEGSGQNTASRSAIMVETASGDPSDDLDTINGGRDGMLVVLRAADDTHTVVLKDGTGNLILGGDITLDTYSAYALLIYNSTLSKWLGQRITVHGHAGAPSGGTIDHDDLTNVTSAQHHNPVTLGGNNDPSLALSTQELTLTVKRAFAFFMGG